VALRLIRRDEHGNASRAILVIEQVSHRGRRAIVEDQRTAQRGQQSVGFRVAGHLPGVGRGAQLRDQFACQPIGQRNVTG